MIDDTRCRCWQFRASCRAAPPPPWPFLPLRGRGDGRGATRPGCRL